MSKCKTYIKFTLIDGTIIFAYSGSALHLQIIETETSVFVTSSRVAIRICNVMSIHFKKNQDIFDGKEIDTHLFQREIICN